MEMAKLPPGGGSQQTHDNPVPTPPEDVMKRAPSDEGLLGVVERLPGELWEKLAVSLGVPLVKVKECSQRGDLGGVDSLVYWRNGRSGRDHPISWEYLLEKVSSGGEGKRAADDLKRKALKKWPSWSISQVSPPQSRTVVRSTTAEPTPSLSTSDNERTRKLKEVYSQCHERMKRFYKSVPAVATGAAVPNVQFINLATVERPSYRAKRGKDIRDFVQASIHGIDGYCEKSSKIHYKDILSHCDVRSGKRVLIAGAPGCGKTTLSRQLCKDLYTKDLDNEYQLVLLVELRRLKVGLDSVEDIDLQYLLKEFKRTLNLPSLCQLVEDSDGEGVALILDGYDEIADRLGDSPFLSDLLSVDNPYLNQCDVFITTRPSRCYDVMSLIRQPHCHVEILGFTDSDIDSYIDSFFRGVYSSDRSQGQAKSQEMIHRLKTLHLVRGMCRIPRVLEIVCKVQDRLGDDPLPKTLSLIFSKYICYQLLDYLKRVGQRAPKIQDVLQVPEELFPGFHSLCEVAYNCCTDERGQRLILSDDDLGDLKQYLDERGSVYSLLFSEYIDEECTEGVLYQFNHKTVMETLAAVHIAKQSPQLQELIWKDLFVVPEMGEVWRVYCGLTRLEHVNLVSLSFSLSERVREEMDHLRDNDMLSLVMMSQYKAILSSFCGYSSEQARKMKDQYHFQVVSNLVMMSLYEANNRSVSGQVLRAVFKNTIHATISFPYFSHVVSYATSHHPNLQKVVLTFPTVSDLSASDLKPLNESIRNLKAVELMGDPPVETVLSTLSGQVEELRLIDMRPSGRSKDNWESVGDALEANHCLRSLHVHSSTGLCRGLSAMMKGLNRNKRLTELSIDTPDMTAPYLIPVESLKSLLVHREKCSLKMSLTRQQWCAVLSGLKEAKKLKELCVDMKEVKVNPNRGAGHDQSDECLISPLILETILIIHDHLVKVDVGCYEEMFEDVGDLVLAMLTGAFRNRNGNISELGIDIRRDPMTSKVDLPSLRFLLLLFVEKSAHTNHITCVRFEYSDWPIVEVLGDMWCDLLVAGPMSRPVCHLRLNLASAECGLLLSRVHYAKQLEELSLAIVMGDESPVDVQAVEGALSNCRLRKLRITAHGRNWYSAQWTIQWPTLFCAVLRGIAANHNDVEFVLLQEDLDGEDLMSQLPHHCSERFNVVQKGGWTYIISERSGPTGSRTTSSPSPSSRVLHSHKSSQLSSSTPLSPPSTSRGNTSLPEKKSVKSGTKVPPSPPQQASQEPSSVEGVIKGTSSFLPYMDKMLPHLLVLGTALEVEDYTAAVTDAPGAPKTKCIKILKEWLDSTPNPTWRVFCEKLKKAKELNRVRGTIEAKEL